MIFGRGAESDCVADRFVTGGFRGYIVSLSLGN